MRLKTLSVSSYEKRTNHELQNRTTLLAINNLVTVGQSRIPLWVEPLSGNAADKKTFRETITSFLESVKESDEPYCFVMDSAFYTTTNLTELSSRIHWLTRAPETVGFVGRLI